MPLVIRFLDLMRESRLRGVCPSPRLPVHDAMFFSHHLDLANENRGNRSNIEISGFELIGLKIKRFGFDLMIQNIDWIAHIADGTQLYRRWFDIEAFGDQFR